MALAHIVFYYGHQKYAYAMVWASISWLDVGPKQTWYILKRQPNGVKFRRSYLKISLKICLCPVKCIEQL